MREFLKYKLENLHVLTGFRQYFKLSDAVDADGNPDGERQIRVLIDGMVLACAQFPMIPDHAKERIIETSMISDQDYTELSARVVFRWLNAHRDRYVKVGESFDETKRIEYTEEESARIDAMITKWKMDLAGANREIFKGIEEDMKQIQQEDKERQEGKKAATHRGWTAEDEAKRELHNRWIRENFDKISGKKLETWLPEDEWLKTLVGGESELMPGVKEK